MEREHPAKGPGEGVPVQHVPEPRPSPGAHRLPGRDAIRAVLEPADTRELYFVSRNDGTHQFSETLTEHNRAVDRYQRRRRRGR